MDGPAFSRPDPNENRRRDPQRPYSPFPADMDPQYLKAAESIDKFNSKLGTLAQHQNFINANFKKMEQNLDKSAEAAEKFTATLRIGALLAIERINKQIGSLSSGMLGLVRAGMQGTVEFEQMQQSFQRFSLAVASAFGPLIKGMSVGFQFLANIVNSLGTEGKAAMVAITLGVAGTTAAVSILITALVTATAVAIAFNISLGGGLLVVGAIITAIAILPAAAMAARAAFVGWEETLKEVLTIILDIGLNLAALFTDWEAFGNISSRPLVDSLFKNFGGSLTQNSSSTFESGRQTFERIQGGIRGGTATLDDVNTTLRQILDEAKKSGQKTVTGGGSGFAPVTPADQGFEAALGYGFTI